ncbi:MAG: NTP transferase domain-containing protein [Saprospiraceae bacterium]|nr:NTP transferase domain-containing protein [Saprospiraceae bacterium]MDZ4706628.1 NTP transferase domain-containing protein [Saprospiraceae bacterium]
MSHQKHTALKRPNLGHFGRNEWAIIGAPCGSIQTLARRLTGLLAAQYKVAYVDADHKSADEAEMPLQTLLGSGAAMEYTDKITHRRFEWGRGMGPFQYRPLFNEQDLILVNGNHFEAARQIVIIDKRKEQSLQKKLDRLGNVQLFLLAEGAEAIYPFLKDHLPGWEQVPVMQIADTERIAAFLQQQLQPPPLYGLVLAGGRSVRMGQDKGLMDYHGKPQREYAADLLNAFCEKTFLSCRSDQVASLDSSYTALPDTFEGLGPFGAILSAFREYPEAAWVVIACDLPLLDAPALQQLVEARRPAQIATAFQSPHDNMPEPLIAIWEPKSYAVLLQFLAQGYSCPRKVLLNTEVHLIEPAQPQALTNVNSLEEAAGLVAFRKS